MRSAILALVCAAGLAASHAIAQPPQVNPEVRAIADAMGMVRGMGPGESLDLVNRIQWAGEGVMREPAARGGQAREYRVAKMVTGVSYHQTAQRVDIQRSASGGAPERVVRVVREGAAWNESTPGVFSSRADAEASWRRLQIGLTPVGFVRELVRNPGQVRTAQEGGKTTMTVPIEGVPVKGVFNAAKRPERLETRTRHPTLGEVTVVTEFHDYKDHDHYGVMFPSRIVQKIGDQTVLDVTITDYHTGSYLIFPVPPQLKAGA